MMMMAKMRHGRRRPLLCEGAGQSWKTAMLSKAKAFLELGLELEKLH